MIIAVIQILLTSEWFEIDQSYIVDGIIATFHTKRLYLSKYQKLENIT